MASCNGLLCCRSCIKSKDLPVRQRKRHRNGLRSGNAAFVHAKDLVIYVCNPTSKDLITLRPTGCDVGVSFGIAVYPFGISANNMPCFKLVGIQLSEAVSNAYSFVLYSSETGKWTTSMEVCHSRYRIHKNRVIFAGNRFHWLTRDHHIITFDLDREVSGIIKLPAPVMKGRGRRGICVGSSEGHFHYVWVNCQEVRVWMLKDYCEPVWVLKERLNLVEFCLEYFDILGPHRLADFESLRCEPETEPNYCLLPFAFHEEVFFFNLCRSLYSFNFGTRRLRKHCFTFSLEGYTALTPTILPYSVCLAAMRILKGNHSRWDESDGNQNDSSSQRRMRRMERKKVKLTKCSNQCSSSGYFDQINHATG